MNKVFITNPIIITRHEFYFGCCEPGVPNTLPPNKGGGAVVVVSLLDEVPLVLPKAPKGDDCGVVVVVVVAGVCPNPSENTPDPEAGVPLVVTAGALL